MNGQKPCVRCERAIDGYAKICPYCNWDQGETPPPPEVIAAENAALVADYVPPREHNWRRTILIGVGIVALLVGSFVVGSIINRDDAIDEAPEPVTEQAPTAEKRESRRADLTLVPANESPGDLPITSAPAADPAAQAPNEYDRSDATAVSSEEYAQLAARAKAEKKRLALVDPLSLTGPAYAQGAPIPPRRSSLAARTGMPPSQTSSTSNPNFSIRTRPVPQHQPIPSLRVSGNQVARLELIVGPDGRVKDVNIKQAIAGETPALIRAVQQWRFKPATENGVPVSAPFSVDISFNGNE